MFQACKNQPTDSQSKSINWYPYDGNNGRYWVSPFITRLRGGFRTQSNITMEIFCENS